MGAGLTWFRVGDITVAICTRDRPGQLRQALTALTSQSSSDFDILVVDQSSEPDLRLEEMSREDRRLQIMRDEGRGLSRARNIAARAAETPWIAFVDDDCLLESDWIEVLRGVIAEYPETQFITGDVRPGNMPPGDKLAAAARPVHEERLITGRWTRPYELGFGVCMVVRRCSVLALGGWDERLGAGVADFPASEDLDFNYRLTRSRAVALATPRLKATHDQWRSNADTVRLYRGYAAASAAFPLKHLLTGDVRGGLWLWTLAAAEIARLLASSIRHRSSLRMRVALAQVVGFIKGTAMALRRPW